MFRRTAHQQASLGPSRKTLAFFALFALLLGGVIVTVGPATTLDQQLYYSFETPFELLRGLGPDGRGQYQLAELLDLGLIGLYTYTLGMAVRRVFPGDRLLVIASFVPGVMDLGETLGVLSLLVRFPERIKAVEALVAVATPSKWLASGVVLLWLAVGVLRRKPQTGVDPS